MTNSRPRVMGTSEVAKTLGVSRQRVLQLAQRTDFPAPLAMLTSGNVWLADDIEQWLENRPPA